MVLFESFDTVFSWHFIVTMALSCIVSEIKRNVGQKSRFFVPPAFDAPVRGSKMDYCHTVWYGKLEWCGYPKVKKVGWYV